MGKNPIILAARITQKRNALEPINEALEEMQKRAEELLGAIDGAENEEDLNDVEKTVDEIQAEIEEKEAEKTALEAEIADLETQLAESTTNEPTQTEGDERKVNIENAETRDLKQGINDYVKSKGETRAGFTSVEGGALIPEELLKPQLAPKDTVDLSSYVNVVAVNSGTGKYPVISKTDSKMTSVAELAANPELAKPTITEIGYDIETYRGYIPVSQEVIDDANYDVTGLIADEIANQELNTRNFYIASAFKAATAKAVQGLDGLKTLINVDIKKIYNTKFYISASLFNALDLLKDENGRYILKDDVTVESGKRLFGKEVIILDDDVIGTADGDLVGFVGDAKAAISLFDRKRASVKWVDNDVYGQMLAGFIRFDVANTDTNAGFYITYTDVPAV